MAARLAKMESIVKESSLGNVPAGNQFLEFDSRHNSTSPPNTHGTSPGPSSGLLFEVDELRSQSKTVLSGQTGIEPIGYKSPSTPVDSDLKVEYTGIAFTLVIFMKLTIKAHSVSSHLQVFNGSTSWLAMIPLLAPYLH
jgi:hypothetical protein